jgi:hypothetical protein
MSDPRDKGEMPTDNLGFLSLGSGWVPIDWLVMVKCLDPKGNVRYREMSSTTLHPVEALGMLTTMGDTMRGRLMRDARSISDWDDNDS